MNRSDTTKPYPNVIPQPSFPKIENAILQFWKDKKIFERSVEFRSNKANSATGAKGEYVFYDGPPFANGLPHYGHLLTGFVKDIVPRYQTMRGFKVERRFGWDCHGLPAEMEAEKDLKISGHQAIDQYGIEKFNAYCQQSVMRYTHEWQRYVTRQARWVDFENDYKTMDLPYMESVIWAFKQLWDKGLIYEGYRVMPYSWACETALSNFETRLDNSYRPRQDPAVTVMFTLKPVAGEKNPLKILAWTTTPWTLPSNLALAVGADIDYVVVTSEGVDYVIAEPVLVKYEKELGQATKVKTIKGRDLVERTYQPLFPYFASAKNSFRVLAGEFVTTEDGTGVVHMAPGFGEDDQKLCEANGISLVVPVDSKGQFTSEITDFAGQQVFDANKHIIKWLKDKGFLVRHETYEHNYPHCWRTDTPIIFRALNSWYVRVTDFRERMVELNQQINWIPSHVQNGQFGKWLEGARDWSISRNRYWGSPIPIWRSDDPTYPRIDVYGSIDEIERDFGVRPANLHRPFIDDLVRTNPDDPTGKSKMRRVEEVLDCWFESGSMPFAQIHYPFENQEFFKKHTTADFIVEYIAQTRGWFYTMMVLGTALFDRPPFKNCICHGVVLDENGQKLSKRLRNYPSPEEVCETYGADALRWFMCSSSILRGSDLQIDREGKAIGEIVRTIINPIWNAYYFFTLYANSDGIKATFSTDSKDLLDRYILAKTKQLVDSVTGCMDAYDIPGACQATTSFIDALTNWYIRRSRERFWKSAHDQDKLSAYNTLYTVLEVLCRTVAPLLPMISEEVYRGLTGKESVHLELWPDVDKLPADKNLVATMDRVREVCSAALSIREDRRLRTRLPLKSLTVAGKGSKDLLAYADLIRDEINIKEVVCSEQTEQFASFRLKVDARKSGPRLGGSMKDVLEQAKAGKWKLLPDGSVEVSGQTLTKDEFTLALVVPEGMAAQAIGSNEAVVVLDVNVTPELEEEGTARDLVRLIQQARKEANFHVADRITLELELPERLRAIITKHQGFIAEQTLASEVKYQKAGTGSIASTVKLGDGEIGLGLTKV